jgi:hypothetical protein
MENKLDPLKATRTNAERGSLILNPRRDPETGFVYYSSEWLGDAREGDERAGMD